MTLGEEIVSWSRHVRDNLDKFLLFALFICLVLLILHMAHDMRDKEQIGWVREITGTILGAFIGLITGAKIAAAQVNQIKKEN